MGHDGRLIPMDFLGISPDLKSLLQKGKLEEHEAEGAKIRLQLELHQVAMRIFRQLYQKARPVDEYYSGPVEGTQQIQPDYNLERIECILAFVPVGTTAMSLQLGERTIPLYAGGALTASQVLTLPNLGLILTENDKRIITLTGTTSNPTYVGLMGHVLERTGHK